MNNPILNQYRDNKKRFGKKVKVISVESPTPLETIAIIKEYNNSPNNSFDDKKIYFDIKDNVNQGDVIEYDNNTYIILLQEENINNIYCKYVMRRCDTSIKIYINKKLCEIPCYIETYQQGIDEGRYIITGKGNLKLTVQDNNVTNKIIEDMRIIKWGYAWKVIAKTAENKGLRYIYFEKVQFNSAKDDMENEIADRWSNEVKHSYSINVDIDNIEIEEGKTKQINVNVTDFENGQTESVKNPTLIYTSLNEDIIEIDDIGLITAIKEGTSTIKIQFENIEKIVNVKVIVKNAIIPVNYYKIETKNTSCPPCIKQSYIENYIVNYYKNNIIQSNTFEFSLINTTTNETTDLARIYKRESNKCSIEASVDKTGQFILRCKDLMNNNIIDKTIDIQSRWSLTTREIQSINIKKDINTVNLNKNLQLKATAKNETFEYKESNVFWYSDNENIAIVDEVGKVTGVSIGRCNIFVSTLDGKFTDKIQINVEEEASKVELEIDGENEMALNRTKTYVSNIPVKWSVENVEVNGKIEKVKYATITENTDTTCTIKATDKWIFADGRSRYFNLIAISQDNSNVVVSKKIRVTSY